MTNSLILEASSEHALVADSQGNTIYLPGGPSLSKCLGAEVQKFVAGRSFGRVIIGAGPGSFTGIRVIAAMGQALAFGWGVPLLTASSLTAFAPEEGNGLLSKLAFGSKFDDFSTGSSPPKSTYPEAIGDLGGLDPIEKARILIEMECRKKSNFAVVLDARSGGLYLQIGFDAPQRLNLEEAAQVLQTIPLITSPHPNKVLQRLPHLANREWRETKPNPSLLERHAIPATHPINLHYLSSV